MIRIFKQYVSPRKIVFITGESALIFIAILLVTYFTLGMGVGLVGTLSLIWDKILLISFTTQFCLYFNDLYEITPSNTTLLASKLIQSIGVTSILLAIIYYLKPDMIIGRWIFFTSLIILLLFIVSWRFLYSLVLNKKLFTENVFILGSGELARDMLREIKNRRDISYDVRAVIAQKGNDHNSDEEFDGLSVKYGFEDLCEYAGAEGISSIIVALDQKRGVMPYEELLSCKVQGINIIDGESFYERIMEKILVEKINPSWLIFSDGFEKSKTARFIKRCSGLIFSSILFLLLAPFLILVAIIIKLESPGPALFSQERVGENGEPFILYKFRSMRADAEKVCGPVWAEENDPRVTKVGKLIRKLRIDELPQLWNVFKGEMSFVGPRPERRFFVDQLKKTIPYYNERFSVKPGVTGWAQIKYPYGSTEKDALEKLKYDLYYIKNMSFAFDLTILFHTVKIMLLGRGSR